ncbi:unnamed protein product [Larinioides sclopetarius]
MTVLGTVFGNLIQAAQIIWAMCGGPVLAIFLLGMLTTRTNEKGALIGLVLGLCTTSWISFGTFASGARPKILPLSSENCQANSTLFSRISSSTLMPMLPETSTLITTSVPKINTETPYIFPLYRISYMWYATLGLLVGVTVGYISSIIISRIAGEYPDVSEDFLSPVLSQHYGKKKGLKRKELEMPSQEEAEPLANGTSIQNSTV